MAPVDTPDSLSVISARVYALILTSPRLRRLLFPHGLLTSPYEILDFNSTWVLDDAQGQRATFARWQRIRFLQQGVGGMLDHAWGDGIVLTHYQHTAGTLADSFRDQGRRHLVVGFQRPMGKGGTLAFGVARTVMEGFRKSEEWAEVAVAHPVRRLRHRVVFPRARPCRRALVHWEDRVVRLPIMRLADGRTMVQFAPAQPRAHTPYTIRWTW